MRPLPEEFDADSLPAVLVDAWGFHVATADYAAVGFGSYHWVVEDGRGARAFVTVDDLDRKPWLGDTRASAFDGLRRAFDTAVSLRESGLEFVVAPIRTEEGETLRRVGPRYTIALFPFVEGEPGVFGRHAAAAARDVVTLLARLHRATPAVASVARRIDLALPGRAGLEAALRGADEPWSGGPLSEPARETIARHRSDVADLLARHDRLAAALSTRSDGWVVTHGEPHAGNVIRTDAGRVLVDWDTVALAPPERDLWMLLGDAGEEAALYADATGHHPDAIAVDFFRLTWDVADIAGFTEVLRSPHRHDEDTETAYDALTRYLTARDQTW